MTTPTIAKSVLTDRNSVYKARDVIEIFIPPEDVPILNPKETYLKGIVQLSGNCLAHPDPRAGVHSLIREVQIYDGQNQQLLEQLENYNVWTAQSMHYNKTPGLNNLRALMEGQDKVEGTFVSSLYWDAPIGGAITYKPVEFCIPLHMSGILSGDKVFPCILTNGLRVRITLDDSVRSLTCLSQIGVATEKATAPNTTQAVAEPTATQLGKLVHSTAGLGADGSFFELKTPIAAGALTAIELEEDPAAVTAPNSAATSQTLSFRQGMQVGVITDAGALLTLGEITSITEAAGVYSCNFASITIAAGDVAAAGKKVCVFGGNFSADYEVRNIDMVCSVVQASQQDLNAMVSKVNSGSVKLDYASFNIYRDNLNARVNRPNIDFNTTEHRAMSIVSFPMDTQNDLLVSNFRPVRDGMTSYQYNIANRLTPNRRVDTTRVGSLQDGYGWNAVHQHELEKALSRWKTAPRYLAWNKEAFGVGRQLAKVGHSFNANDQDVRLNIEYSTAPADNTQEKLLNTWVYHIRTLVISPGSVAVMF